MCNAMHTFVVRVWTPAEPGGEPVSLHGIVEHVGSGEPRRFRGAEELLAALRAGLELPRQAPGAEREARLTS
jgi:hypothetical protein